MCKIQRNEIRKVRLPVHGCHGPGAVPQFRGLLHGLSRRRGEQEVKVEQQSHQQLKTILGEKTFISI